MDISKAVVDIQNRIAAIKKRSAFWIWEHLSGGKVPFYQSRKLDRFQTFNEPTKPGLRRWLWNRAVAYLKKTGDLTYTPTLKEKF